MPTGSPAASVVNVTCAAERPRPLTITRYSLAGSSRSNASEPVTGSLVAPRTGTYADALLRRSSSPSAEPAGVAPVATTVIAAGSPSVLSVTSWVASAPAARANALVKCCRCPVAETATS